MKKPRSKMYPSISLVQAVEIVTKARKLGEVISKGTLATIGFRSDIKGSLNSGAFVRKLSALKQYGLISISGENVTFSDLTTMIVYPKNDSERHDALVKAFLSPRPFSDLFNRLEKSSPVPVDLVRNSAIREMEISEQGVKGFMNSFIDSGMLVGLVNYLDEDRKNIQLSGSDNLVKETFNESTDVVPNSSQNNRLDEQFTPLPLSPNEVQTAKLRLSTGVATVEVPHIISREDKIRLKSLIDVFNYSDDDKGGVA